MFLISKLLLIKVSAKLINVMYKCHFNKGSKKNKKNKKNKGLLKNVLKKILNALVAFENIQKPL